MNTDPLVSIIINAYNSEKHLKEALESALNQTYSNFEIVLWDNCSTDSTKAIVESYRDRRINYYYGSEFTSLGEARNNAIIKSNGELIAFLDSDDVWFPEKLQYQVPRFNNPKVGIVICDTYFFSDNEKKQLYYKKKPKEGLVFRELLSDYFLSMETVVIRRSAIDMDNCFDPRFSAIEEFDLFVRLSYDWHLAYVDKILSKWRVHEDSWTWSKSELFPKERKLMISKLKIMIEDFDVEYKEEIKKMERTCSYEEAQIEFRNGNGKAARKILLPYIFSGSKWFVFFCMTWLPFSFFKFIQKLRGQILPT